MVEVNRLVGKTCCPSLDTQWSSLVEARPQDSGCLDPIPLVVCFPALNVFPELLFDVIMLAFMLRNYKKSLSQIQYTYLDSIYLFL